MKNYPVKWLRFKPLALAAFIGGFALLLGLPARAQIITNTAIVPVWGSVHGQPEVVTFHGFAEVDTKLIKDPDFGTPPTVEISIDLSTVSGVGTWSNKAYVVSGPHLLVRRLVRSDTVDFNFTFQRDGEVSSVRTGTAKFAFSFNREFASVRNARVKISTPQ